MTELERVEIEGFKGLEYVEFEPTDINLITGRNNTGKTSFLEAVNIFSTPGYVSKFSQNLGRITHVDFDKAKVQGKTSDSNSRIQIITPPEEEAKEHFIGLLIDSVSLWVEGSSSPIPYDRETAGETEKVVERSINQAIEQVVKTDRKLLFTNTENKCLELKIGDEVYPYIDLEDVISEVTMEIYDESKRILESKFEDVTFGEHRGLTVIRIDSEDRNVFFDFRGELWQGSFLEEPPSQAAARFVGSNRQKGIPEGSREEYGLKIDNIGDLIKEKNLLDNLKTFTLNYLVFEEDGEKYDVPFEFMGDGFKSIVGLLWELMDDDVQDQIVLLEEPENHMHPGYVREMVYFLIDLAREENVQLFITTHDSDFINDFFTENLTDEEEAYLEDEFSLLRMEEDSAVVEDYETARENLKEHHLDLRGI